MCRNNTKSIKIKIYNTFNIYYKSNYSFKFAFLYASITDIF